MSGIPMLLWCPECGQRHIDEGEFAEKEHHTHACQHCGHCWRPAVVATSGVRFLPGFKNEGHAMTDKPTIASDAQALAVLDKAYEFPITNPHYMRDMKEARAYLAHRLAPDAGVDEDMAMHWIQRYAAGIDSEPNLEAIAEALATPRRPAVEHDRGN